LVEEHWVVDVLAVMVVNLEEVELVVRWLVEMVEDLVESVAVAELVGVG